MKKYLFIFVFIAFLFMPSHVFAIEGYNTLTFREALKEENIEEAFSNYSENDDQITIYMFRGRGCGFCQRFLTFMNSITEEYGKYFKMVTFEVWYDDENEKLFDEVSEFLDQPAGGVPYIIIGDKVFDGYTSSYDEDIKSAIQNLYNTKKENRYDVFTEMEKAKKKSEGISNLGVILWNLAFVTVSTGVILIFINKKFKDLNEKIKNLTKEAKKQTK